MTENTVGYFNERLFTKNVEERTYIGEFSLISQITEEEQLPYRMFVEDDEFIFNHVDASTDGKIVHWIYWPSKNAMNENPDVCGWGIKIYNG